LAVGILPAGALANGHGNGHNKSTTSGSSSGSARSQAQKQCREERAKMGEATFEKTYGTNKNGKNAFGKCLSHRTNQDQATQQSAQTSAEKTCRSEQNDSSFASSHNGKTFDQFYGTNKNGRNAFGKCVSHRTRQNQQAQQSAHNSAVQTCRSEQSSDPAAFRTKYGTNHNGRNAFGKCVSSHERSSSQKTESSEVKAEENAAKQCRSEQSSDPAAFRTKYGTNHNGHNAFGKCVSQKAQQQEQQSGSGGGSGSSSS
jgi:hypothetical protein